MHEARVGFVDEPLRFCSDGVEDQRGLARSGHAGDNGELALGDAHVHVLEVVFAAPQSDNGAEIPAPTAKARLPAMDAGGGPSLWPRGELPLPAGTLVATRET